MPAATLHQQHVALDDDCDLATARFEQRSDRIMVLDSLQDLGMPDPDFIHFQAGRVVLEWDRPVRLVVER